MRRHLPILLALLVLLMQPAALLHLLSHAPAGTTSAITSAATTPAATSASRDRDGAADAHAAAGLDCLQCLAFAALGGTAPPLALLLFRAPLLRHAAPGGATCLLGGGTGAGYHARGPPVLA